MLECSLHSEAIIASAIIRLTKPPTIKAAGSTKVIVREKADDGDDSGSGWFPIAIARKTESSRRQSFGEPSAFFLAC
ncbi:hypothetical protein AUH73_01115 [archaeon 13_1_40CM_4_53_4]|nr:MAG: hypothetical protein AUH73_01115 [archaeon 13_1_40CM_4_53_4]